MGSRTINRQKLALALLVIVLVFCNLVFASSAGWWRLVFSFFGYAGLLACFKLGELSLADIGLARSNLKSGLKYGFYVILVVVFIFLAIFFIDRQAFKDPRYHHDLATALYASLILLPLKTVIFEELAFRGIGLALLLKLKNNRWLAGIISSLAFGLWHVSSSLSIGRYNAGDNIIVAKPLVITVAVIATTLAGLILCELRWRSKSLAAPAMAHWFVNALAIVLAALSWR